TASRMLYSLSRHGDAPAIMGRTNRSKTPYVAVLLSTGAAFLTGLAFILVTAITATRCTSSQAVCHPLLWAD
ncbi:hypothetical protein PUR36_32665, partial [Klebsiella pneumoniae]|uniref:hypothetical protein n=1 Tax=Klebsiella pneumoniae TaxID=573 RepID=UPI0023F7D0EA